MGNGESEREVHMTRWSSTAIISEKRKTGAEPTVCSPGHVTLMVNLEVWRCKKGDQEERPEAKWRPIYAD